MATLLLADNTTGTGQAVEHSGKRTTGAIQVQGLSQDTITIRCDAGQGPGAVAEIDENGWTALSPAPDGSYDLTRSGTTDSITVLLQI
ncbi:hypothetical protein OSG_eHP7_00175 [environmental Halophage eHP-7]|jgi:hypothetical protein|nr:hypothetical protein OSG_eHP7_00175 [environmental Halophage eHP-7]